MRHAIFIIFCILLISNVLACKENHDCKNRSIKEFCRSVYEDSSIKDEDS